MIVTCIDSSALLRLVFGEGDLHLPRQALNSHPIVSAMATVEVPCAIEARVLRGEYPAASRQLAREGADRLLSGLSVVRLTTAVQRATVEIAEQHLLRTIDALHIASALLVARRERRHGNIARFCTADRRQAEVASALLDASSVDFVPPWR